MIKRIASLSPTTIYGAVASIGLLLHTSGLDEQLGKRARSIVSFGSAVAVLLLGKQAADRAKDSSVSDAATGPQTTNE